MSQRWVAIRHGIEAHGVTVELLAEARSLITALASETSPEDPEVRQKYLDDATTVLAAINRAVNANPTFEAIWRGERK